MQPAQQRPQRGHRELRRALPHRRTRPHDECGHLGRRQASQPVFHAGGHERPHLGGVVGGRLRRESPFRHQVALVAAQQRIRGTRRDSRRRLRRCARSGADTPAAARAPSVTGKARSRPPSGRPGTVPPPPASARTRPAPRLPATGSACAISSICPYADPLVYPSRASSRGEPLRIRLKRARDTGPRWISHDQLLLVRKPTRRVSISRRRIMPTFQPLIRPPPAAPAARSA